MFLCMSRMPSVFHFISGSVFLLQSSAHPRLNPNRHQTLFYTAVCRLLLLFLPLNTIINNQQSLELYSSQSIPKEKQMRSAVATLVSLASPPRPCFFLPSFHSLPLSLSFSLCSLASRSFGNSSNGSRCTRERAYSVLLWLFDPPHHQNTFLLKNIHQTRTCVRGCRKLFHITFQNFGTRFSNSFHSFHRFWSMNLFRSCLELVSLPFWKSKLFHLFRAL